MSVRSQQGSALIFVTIVGLVMSMAFALFMTSTVLTEQRAVEAQLATTRTYWAQMGNFHYAMSRLSYSRICGALVCLTKWKDTDTVPVLQAYFNELSNNKVWTYADEAAGYSITTTTTAAVDEDPSRQTYSGWLKATSAYTASSLVAASAGKLPLMELRLCTGLGGAGAKCGDIDNNNGGNPTAYFSVNRLTNLPAP
jgi:hypothetical protein